MIDVVYDACVLFSTKNVEEYLTTLQKQGLQQTVTLLRRHLSDL